MTQQSSTPVQQPSSEMLPPAKTEAKAEAVACSKAKMPFRQMVPLAVAAGFFIGLGAVFFTFFVADTAVPFSIRRAIGGASFALGLSLVLICGAELYTGNALMVTAFLSKKISLSQMILNWLGVWVFNFAGAVILVALVFLSDTPKLGNMADAMVSVAEGKLSLSSSVMFFKGILCNILVCIAVWVGFAGKTVTDKVIGILLPIAAFVALGFEHCVANMYFLPAGLLAAGDAAGTVFAASEFFRSFFWVTLGNTAGGMLVGILYWFAYGRK